MVKSRLLALLGAFVVGLAPTVAAAQLQRAPAYTSGGQPTAATGVFCLNLDGTSCTFGGGGGGGGGAVTVASGADVVEGALTDTSSTSTIFGVLQAIKAAAQDVTTENPVKVANGSDIALGATTDSACSTDTGTCSIAALVKRLNQTFSTLGVPYGSGAPIVCNATASMTGTTQTSLCAAPGAGLRNYVTQIECGNSSATVGTFVDVEDGSGGTVLKALPAAINYGGGTFTFPLPGLRQPTLNTALFLVNETTGSAVKCSAIGYKAP